MNIKDYKEILELIKKYKENEKKAKEEALNKMDYNEYDDMRCEYLMHYKAYQVMSDLEIEVLKLLSKRD